MHVSEEERREQSMTTDQLARFRQRITWALEDSTAGGLKLYALLAEMDLSDQQTLWEEITLHLADCQSHLINALRHATQGEYPMNQFQTVLTHHPVTLELRPEYTPTAGRRYTASLTYEGRMMTTPFSTESGWKREPTVEEVLNCLLDDALSITVYSFPEWQNECAVGLEVADARELYNALCEQQAQLQAFLGDAYQDFLYPEEFVPPTSDEA
jgi:hypothetical protein